MTRGTVLASFSVLTFACVQDAPPRPQLVVEIDTDAPVTGQVLDDAAVPASVAVDALRVDVLGEDGAIVDVRDFAVPDPRDWPVSFGIASRAGTRRAVRLRVRAFRASLADRGELDGTTTLEPPTDLVIDRLVDLEQPEDGVTAVRVVLAAACTGALASLTPDVTTCVDAGRRREPPSSGVLRAGGPSRVGSAVETQEVPCAGEAPPGTVCIPGGAFALGSRISVRATSLPTFPRRAVRLSPFYMDVTEMTVGRYRTLVARGAVDREPTSPESGSRSLDAFCTWRGPGDARNDALPVNCIGVDAAAAACQALGGRLPTEAEWEYAARGRGQARERPWGDASPQCCTSSISRFALSAEVARCTGSGVEPVGSHLGANCATGGDVSRDGVLDLGGSVGEWILDGGAPYSDACWNVGLASDPRCADASRRGTSSRGGDWASSPLTTRSAVRRITAPTSSQVGFRCVYQAAP